jgi:hypothetical protein
MYVNTDGLHSGAAHSHSAGQHAQNSSQHLSGAQLGAGMFGDFAAADSFHDVMSAAHAHHIAAADAHHKILTTVGVKARGIANAFTATEKDNVQELRGVRCT